MPWLRKPKGEGVTGVSCKKSKKKEGVYIVSWDKTKKLVQIDVSKDGSFNHTTFYPAEKETKHFFNLEPESNYEFIVKIRSGNGHGQRTSICTGPMLPAHWNVVERNGGIHITGTLIPKIKYFVEIKSNKVLLDSFDVLERIDQAFFGYLEPNRKVSVKMHARGLRSGSRSTLCVKKRIQFRGVLDVSYKIYKKHTTVKVVYFLDGSNPKDEAERLKGYATVTETDCFTLKPKQRTKSNLKCEPKDKLIHISPKKGHEIAHKQLLKSRYLERTFNITVPKSMVKVRLVHDADGTKAPFTLEPFSDDSIFGFGPSKPTTPSPSPKIPRESEDSDSVPDVTRHPATKTRSKLPDESEDNDSGYGSVPVASRGPETVQESEDSDSVPVVTRHPATKTRSKLPDPDEWVSGEYGNGSGARRSTIPKSNPQTPPESLRITVHGNLTINTNSSKNITAGKVADRSSSFTATEDGTNSPLTVKIPPVDK